MIELAPAPRRTAKTWSVILLTIIGTADAAMVFLHAVLDMFVLSVTALAAINAGMVFLVIVVRFVSQSIPITAAERADLMAATLAAPKIGDAT